MEYLIAHDISYIHPDKEILFEKLDFSVQQPEKVAIIGNNGSGKSTFLKILCGLCTQDKGSIKRSSIPYYIPQHFGQYNNCSIAEALEIEKKLSAFYKIQQGHTNNDLLSILNEDWNIEERSQEALRQWDLTDLNLDRKMDKLSGGEKTKVFLAGILIHMPKIILLDEPTNHLDIHSRNIFYNYVKTTENILVTVSHDRVLLEMLHPVYELKKSQLTMYGGNYSFFKEQKSKELKALKHTLKEKEKSLKAFRKTALDTIERKQRSDSRGTKKHKGNVPPVLLHQLRNKAQKSSSKLKAVHSEKIESISKDILNIRKELPHIDEMRMNFNNTSIYLGKILVKAESINFKFGSQKLWSAPISFEIKSGDRIIIEGNNGTGKTTLIRLIIGDLSPSEGGIKRSSFKSVYIDQEYSLIENQLTIYEQAQKYNDGALQEHEIKIRLYRYLFDRESWTKSCANLSGGEKMKLALCCLMISASSPDIFVLDEPTNNLDIQNIEILTTAISNYHGTLIVISHDIKFLEDIGISRKIQILNGKISTDAIY